MWVDPGWRDWKLCPLQGAVIEGEEELFLDAKEVLRGWKSLTG
jgi:hypothetical protein